MIEKRDAQNAHGKPVESNGNGLEIERRTVKVTELRVMGDDKSPKITGYAALFDTLSEELYGFFERIKPGAFAKTIKEADVRALFNHDANYVLGRTSAGTLSLEEDEKGLKFEIDPPDTQWARDLITSMKRDDINQMSFGFRTIRDEWISAKEKVIRTLVEVKLFDVSPVTFPAYPQTSAQVRSKVLELQAGNEPVEPPGNSTGAPGSVAHPPADQQGSQERLRMLKRKLDLEEKRF